MIEVKNLSCSFSEGAFTKNKFTAVSPISAIFKNGGRYAIVGESGSGKTTLARMIAGLQRPDNGNVLIDGKGKTVIMIAHRLSTIQDADQILVMKQGKLAEQGTHTSLVEQNGEYARMWENYTKTTQWHIGNEVKVC